MESGVVPAEIALDDFAFGREYVDALIGAGVDVAGFIDYDGSVGWADCGLSVGSQSPSRNGVEGHSSGAHPYGFDGRGGIRCILSLRVTLWVQSAGKRRE